MPSRCWGRWTLKGRPTLRFWHHETKSLSTYKCYHYGTLVLYLHSPLVAYSRVLLTVELLIEAQLNSPTSARRFCQTSELRPYQQPENVTRVKFVYRQGRWAVVSLVKGNVRGETGVEPIGYPTQKMSPTIDLVFSRPLGGRPTHYNCRSW